MEQRDCSGCLAEAAEGLSPAELGFAAVAHTKSMNVREGMLRPAFQGGAVALLLHTKWPNGARWPLQQRVAALSALAYFVVSTHTAAYFFRRLESSMFAQVSKHGEDTYRPGNFRGNNLDQDTEQNLKK